MSTHSAPYLRRRTLVRWVVWTPVTLLGWGMFVYALVTV